MAAAMLEEGALAGAVTPEGAMLEAKAAATAVAETLEAVMQAPEAATRELGTAAGVVAETPAEGAAREGPIAVMQVVVLEAGETLAWEAMLEERTPGVVEGIQAGALWVVAEVEVRGATAAVTRGVGTLPVEVGMLQVAQGVAVPAQVAALVSAAATQAMLG